MIDFHAHILPKMDDGAESVAVSLAMLRQSFLQGVDAVVATSHFYANEEYPKDFLRRRDHALGVLRYAMLMSPEVYPAVIPGAEVLYFPGISEAEEIPSLMIGASSLILIEPPMAPWTDGMLDEIVRLGENFRCTPVIAHLDRYMRLLRDKSLPDRIRERNLAAQVNAEYFLDPQTQHAAVQDLKKGHFRLIGSDCHNLDSRPPNLGLARKQARKCGVEAEFSQLHKNASDLLRLRRNS